jgi:hypothetical protein
MRIEFDDLPVESTKRTTITAANPHDLTVCDDAANEFAIVLPDVEVSTKRVYDPSMRVTLFGSGAEGEFVPLYAELPDGALASTINVKEKHDQSTG